MRILVVSDLPQFVTGGAEMQAARLIEAWLEEGHEVRCMGRRMGDGPVQFGPHLVSVQRIRTIVRLGRWGRAASYFLSLSWLLMRHRRWADVVYTRFLGEAAVTAAMLKAAGLLDCVLVATPANTRGNGDTNLLRTLPHGRFLISLLDRNCDAINLIAPDMADELWAAGFSGTNFTRIPNGIPLKEIPERQSRAAPAFIAVGRLTPQKGYDVLLEAMAMNKHLLTEGQVSIVGDGPEKARLLALAERLGVDDRVSWRGEVSPDEVRSLMARCDVFLLPSRYEGLSNAGLEAMECALPLIISRCGGLDRYVDADTGWIVPPGDPNALADALSDAISAGGPRLRRMGALCRQVAEANFDMRSVAVRYLALFGRLYKKRRDARGTA